MAEDCPFGDFEEMILFLANNVRTGGDNQLLYDGRERSGKTTLARTVNRYLFQALHADKSQGVPDWVREWNFIDNVVFDFEDWEDIYGRNEDMGIHQVDEAGNLLFSRNAMTGESKQVVQTVQMCGIRHATMSWVLPNKHWMDPYIREHRATVWGHVHTSHTLAGMTRGTASFHWRQDNYMTGNVWWSNPIIWVDFQEMHRDAEQRAYDEIKAAKLYKSTISQSWAKGRKK